MIGFHAILCMLFLQTAVVLGSIAVFTDEYCIYIHKTTNTPPNDPAPASFCPAYGPWVTPEVSVDVEIFAGFPGGSTKPKWRQVFSLTKSGEYHFKKDYCLWLKNILIGCAKGCVGGADGSFENPYGGTNPTEPAGKDPTHGTPPSDLPAKQKMEFANTCSNSRTSYNFESQESSPERISNAQIEDSESESDTTQDTGLEQPIVPPPSQQSFDISSVPDTYDQPNTDSTSETPETSEPIDWEIYQRSVRKSPRNFRI